MGLDNEEVFFPNKFAEDAGSDDVLLGSEEVLLGSSLLDIFGKYKFSGFQIWLQLDVIFDIFISKINWCVILSHLIKFNRFQFRYLVPWLTPILCWIHKGIFDCFFIQIFKYWVNCLLLKWFILRTYLNIIWDHVFLGGWIKIRLCWLQIFWWDRTVFNARIF